jgi:hypothetical protein
MSSRRRTQSLAASLMRGQGSDLKSMAPFSTWGGGGEREGSWSTADVQGCEKQAPGGELWVAVGMRGRGTVSDPVGEWGCTRPQT